MVRAETETIFKQNNKKARNENTCGTLDYPDLAKIDDVCISGELFFVDDKPFLLPLREIEVTHQL